MSSPPIVFIHGMFMTPKCWASWVTRFEEAGHTCHTPAFPFHHGRPDLLRQQPDEQLGQLKLSDVEQRIAETVDKLPVKPILVGHSMGGLIAQRLVAAGKASAAVCISSAPPSGVSCIAASFVRCNAPIINPFRLNTPFLPTKTWFRYAFAHTMSQAASDRVFDEQVVPESRNIPRNTQNEGRIDFRAAHPPLLFIAGQRDHLFPAGLNRKNAAKYRHTDSRVDFHQFDDRTHLLCMQDGWEAVADHVLEWIKTV